MDGAGEIVEVGDGVRDWRVGEAVLAHFRSGAFAQYTLIAANDGRLAIGPEASDFAMLARRANGLVIGATGGVGLFIVQLAKDEGVRVVATGKAEDERYLRELGADDIVDYSGGDVIAQVVQRYARGVDAVFDLINMGGGVTSRRRRVARIGHARFLAFRPGSTRVQKECDRTIRPTDRTRRRF
jgi:NADPH:quinone reductase-like Zn-dependent oxidoreductase